MNLRTTLAVIVSAVALLTTTGCAVTRGQQRVGAYVDDATITTQIKSRMLDSPQVAGTSVSVETLNGTVILSGFATSGNEREAAERIARDVNGVKVVKNGIVIRR